MMFNDKVYTRVLLACFLTMTTSGLNSKAKIFYLIIKLVTLNGFKFFM